MFMFPSIVYTIILMINYNAASEFQMALFRSKKNFQLKSLKLLTFDLKFFILLLNIIF